MGFSLAELKEKINREEILQRLIGRPFRGDLYLVGGAVREIFLDATPKDYDFVLTEEGDLGVLESIFGARSFVLGKKGLQTHRIVVRDVSLDIMFLGEGIDSDLRRRDFTMNAIAFHIGHDRILDPLNGIGDIEKRVIRYPSKKVLSDDPLRMLKAIRQFSTLPGFVLDKELLEAIRELRSLINGTAPERIRSELDQIMTSERVFEGVKAMEGTGLLFELVPELSALRQMDREKKFVLETYGHGISGFQFIRKYSKLYGLDTAEARVAGYALLFHDLGKAHTFSYDEKKDAVHFFYHERFSCDIARSIMERLRFSGNEVKAVLSLVENHMRIFLISGPESTDRATRRLVYKMGNLTPLLIVLTLCDMFGSALGMENPTTFRVEEKCRAILEAYYEWRREPLPRLIDGHDLLSYGFKSGPAIGMILAEVREKQIAGELRGREEALQYVQTLLQPPAV